MEASPSRQRDSKYILQTKQSWIAFNPLKKTWKGKKKKIKSSNGGFRNAAVLDTAREKWQLYPGDVVFNILPESHFVIFYSLSKSKSLSELRNPLLCH